MLVSMWKRENCNTRLVRMKIDVAAMENRLEISQKELENKTYHMIQHLHSWIYI